LLKTLDVLQADRQTMQRLAILVEGLNSGQVQKRIKQHRRMAGSQFEPVSVYPGRGLRTIAEIVSPKRVGYGRQTHSVPGWPDLAFYTASIESVRIVLMLRRSISSICPGRLHR
jgi:hypothetical protein